MFGGPDRIRLDPVDLSLTGPSRGHITKAWLECYRPGHGDRVAFSVKDYTAANAKQISAADAAKPVREIQIEAVRNGGTRATLTDHATATEYTGTKGVTVRNDFHDVSVDADLAAPQGPPVHVTGAFTCDHGFTNR